VSPHAKLQKIQVWFTGVLRVLLLRCILFSWSVGACEAYLFAQLKDMTGGNCQRAGVGRWGGTSQTAWLLPRAQSQCIPPPSSFKRDPRGYSPLLALMPCEHKRRYRLLILRRCPVPT
jgi:hypothetical protein